MKTGWKTTEFWVTTTAIIGLALTSFVSSLPEKYAALGASLAAGFYAISRGLAKLNTPQAPAAQEVPVHVTVTATTEQG